MKHHFFVFTLAAFVLSGCQKSQSEAGSTPVSAPAAQATITIEQSKDGPGNVNTVHVGEGGSASTVFKNGDDSVTVAQPEHSEVHVVQSVDGNGKTNAVTVTGPALGGDARGGISIKQSAKGNGNVNSVVIQ
ncbi:hypothetical protein [Pandoraea communis]|uniref:hypothetical protein n=1 Tax=Pandoraea communis TaxID=2508297 RepID=UPI0025A5C329|nr:hypothetical protein [Pandoraea communis]MDM8356565.1 hypothetical protein [Pandoraea communis]